MTVSYFEWVQDEQHLFWEAQDVYNRLERVMKTRPIRHCCTNSVPRSLYRRNCCTTRTFTPR
jgi:glutamate dehydrogenase/leucine dehydrogenase